MKYEVGGGLYLTLEEIEIHDSNEQDGTVSIFMMVNGERYEGTIQKIDGDWFDSALTGVYEV